MLREAETSAIQEETMMRETPAVSTPTRAARLAEMVEESLSSPRNVLVLLVSEVSLCPASGSLLKFSSCPDRAVTFQIRSIDELLKVVRPGKPRNLNS